MAYLRDVVTYHIPAEAEVDKAYLEANGLTVCLLNANTTRNELGPAFFIRLQVADEEHAKAVRLLREVNPSRFGSVERVAELERVVRRGLLIFLLGAIPAGLLYFLIGPAPDFRPNPGGYLRPPPDLRPVFTVVAAVLGGVLATRIAGGKKPQSKAAAAPEAASGPAEGR